MRHDVYTRVNNSITLHTKFSRVLKTTIRTKSEIRKKQENRGFIGIVFFVGPSAEPQPETWGIDRKWVVVKAPEGYVRPKQPKGKGKKGNAK